MARALTVIFFLLFIASIVTIVKPTLFDARFKRKYAIYAAIVFFLAFATAAGQAGINPAGDTSTTTVASTAPKNAFDWKTAQITDGNVRMALKGVKGAGIVSAGNLIVKGGNIEIDATISDSYNAKDLLQDVSWSQVAFAQALFANPNVQDVTLSVSAPFQDAKGNDKTEVAANVMWSRKTSDGVNYANFVTKNEADYTSAFTIADDYMIHPALLSGLNASDKAKLTK